MKDSREAINAMVRGEPIRPVVAPLWDGIFGAALVGKQYASDVTLDEKLEVAELCGFDPIFQLDPGMLWAGVEALQAQARVEHDGDMRVVSSTLRTPAGTISVVSREPPHAGPTCIRDATGSEVVYDVLEWFDNKVLGHRDLMLAEAKKVAAKYGGRAALGAGWMTPFELSFMAYPTVITSYLDHRDRHRELMELHMAVVNTIMGVVSEAGWDGFSTAGPPIELVGMNMYEEVAVPYLIRYREMAHEHGLWFRFHNCGHIRGLLEAGTYNRIRPDIFETLAPPPMGELDDLRWARKQLDPAICTRGNMDLEFLKHAAPADVARRAKQILDETAGYKHLVATTDEILAHTPVENVRALVEGSTAK